MRTMWCVMLCLIAGGMRLSAQKPDIPAARAAIMKADEDFNQSVADRNKERFLSLIADAATFGGGTGNEQKGKDAIWKGWSVFFDPKGPTLTWHPSKAEVLAGGDVGYTTGFSELRTEN
jgi:ketosteroid isomerase-like protein